VFRNRRERSRPFPTTNCPRSFGPHINGGAICVLSPIRYPLLQSWFKLLHSYFQQIEFGALPLRAFISLQATSSGPFKPTTSFTFFGPNHLMTPRPGNDSRNLLRSHFSGIKAIRRFNHLIAPSKNISFRRWRCPGSSSKRIKKLELAWEKNITASQSTDR